MINRATLINVVNSAALDPESIVDSIMGSTVYLGRTVYVVTQYFPSQPFEVVEAVVTTMRFNPKTSKKCFTVTGRWKNGNYYNATFTESSINKTVYFDRKLADAFVSHKNNV